MRIYNRVFLIAIAASIMTAPIAADTVSTPKPEIGWWFYCPDSADHPGVEGALKWVTEHKNIVSTLMMHCGIYTCAVNHSAPRGGNFSCLNNGGIGGQVHVITANTFVSYFSYQLHAFKTSCLFV